MAGHRALAHTADTILEAWGDDLEECLTEAAVGLVASFADVTDAPVVENVEADVSGDSPEAVLLAVLDEVVYRLDAAGLVPVRVQVTLPAETARVSFEMTSVDDVVQRGAPPKAVSRHELAIQRDDDHWRCRFLVDV